MLRSMFDALLSKAMTRKEFLVHLGLLLLAVSGISSLLITVASPTFENHFTKTKYGFGNGPYGGRGEEVSPHA